MHLQGKFDPTLLNSTVLQDILLKIITKDVATYGEFSVMDLSKQLMNQLVARKIIR